MGPHQFQCPDCYLFQYNWEKTPEWANDRGMIYYKLYLILHLINKHNLIYWWRNRVNKEILATGRGSDPRSRGVFSLSLQDAAALTCC